MLIRLLDVAQRSALNRYLTQTTYNLLMIEFASQLTRKRYYINVVISVNHSADIKMVNELGIINMSYWLSNKIIWRQI